jgi:hypothetical protein
MLAKKENRIRLISGTVSEGKIEDGTWRAQFQIKMGEHYLDLIIVLYLRLNLLEILKYILSYRITREFSE